MSQKCPGQVGYRVSDLRIVFSTILNTNSVAVFLKVRSGECTYVIKFITG